MNIMARVKKTPARRSPPMHFRVKVNLWRQAVYGARGQYEPTTRGRHATVYATASRVELCHYLGIPVADTCCRLVFRD